MPISVAAKTAKLKEFNSIMKKRGWQGLEDEYIDCHQIMKFICDKGHHSGLRFRVLTKTSGNGCPACRKTNKWNLKDVQEAAASRGWKALSESIVNTKTKFLFECESGHAIEMLPERMFKGTRCYKCVEDKKISVLSQEEKKTNPVFSIGNLNKIADEEVIERLQTKGYRLVDYSGSMSSPSIVKCLENHQRTATVKAILKEKSICPECKKNSDYVIFESMCIERGFTVKGKYTNRTAPVSVICDKNHSVKIDLISLKRGRGCPSCQSTPKKTNTEVREILEAEGYSWLTGNYDNIFTPLGLQCPNGHKIQLRLHSFLNSKTRCSGCCETGFDQSKPGILYYLRFEKDRRFYYKIGITNLSVAARFKNEKTPFKIIKETYYEWGAEALEQESKILRDYKQYKYNGKPFLKNGNSELFEKDILLLDLELIEETISKELL